MNEDILVKMENISMEFPGVKALKDVHFELKKGEVHVLLGENGAGKSTLIKILAGVYKKTGGVTYYKGKELHTQNIKQTQNMGISVIYQELNLFPFLNVAENIFIGREPMKGNLIDWKKIYKDTENLLNELKVDISPKTRVKDLGIAQKQMIEVAKALSKNSDVIVMDEPTSALTEKEITELFRTIKELKSKGVGIVYISHRLEELKEIGDRATIFRDGEYIDTVQLKDVDIEQLITLMVGRTLKDKFPKENIQISEEVLRVENISTKSKLKNCSFSLNKGEILGISGLMGAGRTELVRAITGVDEKTSGEVYIKGKLVKINNFRSAVNNRIGLLPEDRKGQGLILGLDVKQNITLAKLEKMLKLGFLNLAEEKKVATKLSNDLRIKTPSISQKVKFLSGGNQQKVVLAKCLYTECEIIIFDEPTRGIDVGAKVEIYKLMQTLVKEGASIIMISSELPEILGMSDRILVMREGAIVSELNREEANQERILHFATGGLKSK